MNNTVKKFKQRKIQKAQLGTLLKKGWDWFKNSNQVAAIAESPAVMTAFGWRVDKNGKAKQDQQNTKEIKQLRNNLATIGEAGITAPTMVGDIGVVYNVVRHPVQTGKAIGRIPSDIKFFLKEKNPLKIYHSNRQGKHFPLYQGRNASSDNIGLHVTPNRSIAESFDSNPMSGYISSIPDMKTIDLGQNNYNLMSNNVRINKNYLDFANGDDSFRIGLIQKYGGNPSYIDNPVNPFGKYIKIEKEVNIPLRNETFPNAPKEFDNLLSNNTVKTREDALKLNKKVSDLLSQNGKKIIEYNNRFGTEGGGGTSYIITDPKVIHQPENWVKPLSLFRYVGYNQKN